MSDEEQAKAARPEPQKVLFIIGSPGSARVFKGEAFIFPDYIYIERLDHKGLAWLKTRTLAESIELRIVSQQVRNRTRETLSEGFVSINYINHRDSPDKTIDSIERFVALFRVEHPFPGTPLHRNYHKITEDRKYWYVEEWVLHSDSAFVSHIEKLGPYSILNGLPSDRHVMPSLIFRAYIHRSFQNIGSYAFKPLALDHPGFREYRERTIVSFSGEMAALLTVSTDKRVLGGGSIRMFASYLDDPMGRPSDPGPPPHIYQSDRSILPYYSRTEKINLETVTDFITKYLELNKHDAATFLRASLLYQRALLQCDHEPDLAWVWCISAVETLAEEPGSIGNVSAKFLELLKTYLPAPLPVRPLHLRVDWANLEASLKQVYAYRSQFLHAGLPFPAPMNRRPDDESGNGRYAERPRGGLGYGGTTFDFSASPMHFHVFLHIVRGVMINWLDHAHSARGRRPEFKGETIGQNAPSETSIQ